MVVSWQEVSGVEGQSTEVMLPSVISLSNYPNPFNSSTKITYELPQATEVKLDILNLLGQRVVSLFSGAQPAGAHHISWDASGFDSGVYFLRLSAEGATEAKKLLLLK
jgi:hypothetical protein